MIDYYKILNVSRAANPDKIKSAFRDLAKKYHPDISGARSEEFLLLKEAFDTLFDPVKRRNYDRKIGILKPPNQSYRSDRVFVHPAKKDVFDDLVDVVTDRFHLPRKQKLEFDLFLTDNEFKRGAETTITIPQEKICPRCFGFGGTLISKCGACRGSGLVDFEVEFDLSLKPPLAPGQVYELIRNNHRLLFRLRRGR